MQAQPLMSALALAGSKVAVTRAGVPTGVANPVVSTVTVSVAHCRPWLASVFWALDVASARAWPAVRATEAVRAAWAAAASTP